MMRDEEKSILQSRKIPAPAVSSRQLQPQPVPSRKNKPDDIPACNRIKPNEINGCGKTEIIKLDYPTPATYLSFGRYLLDDFGFCDFVRNRTNFPSDSNKSFSVTFA
jgi:hypothetical protein